MRPRPFLMWNTENVFDDYDPIGRAIARFVYYGTIKAAMDYQSENCD